MSDMPTTIRYTKHGVPHVTADSHFELGRGAGYASAEQNLGLLADRWMTLRGDRSRVYGPDRLLEHGPIKGVTNLQSDLFWRYLQESGTLRRILSPSVSSGPSEPVRQMCDGYAAGYNQYLRHAAEHGIDDPRFDPRTWLIPIDTEDVFRQALHWNLFRSSVALIPQIIAGTEGDHAEWLKAAPPTDSVPEQSNMLALGGEVTASGRGMLYANPHWYWSGPDSFREMHLTIPGVLDVYGSVVPGLPFVMTGFTHHIAYAGTSSLSPRFSVYRLDLDPHRSTSYLYDGASRPMSEVTVQCPVVRDGAEDTVQRTFLSTHHGPLLGGEQYPRDHRHAYCMREVGMSVRWLDQQLDLMTAQTVQEADERSQKHLGVGWRNLAVADRNGDVLYADRTAIPNVSDAQLDRSPTLHEGSIMMNGVPVAVLDGSTSADEWATDPDAPVQGIIGVSRLPRLSRRDYVANENDSHWTNHAHIRLEGHPKIVGNERRARTLRTRSGLAMIERLLAESSRSVTLADLHAATERDEVWSATLWRDAVCSACEEDGSEELADAARVLRAWDGCEHIDSRGAMLWRRFYAHFAGADSVPPEQCFSVPFRVDQALATPSGINLEYGIGVLKAMRRAMTDLDDIGADIAVGSAQYVTKNGRPYPVPGGPGEPGQYNKIETAHGFVRGQGYPDVVHGTGFRLWIGFTTTGVEAYSILAYSQSDDPSSAYHADQTAMLASGDVKAVRFSEEDVEAATIRRVSL
ncbi:penicillin acylase family protein [Streptomyces sp. NPDC004752]